jgi:hypothetical protein
MIIPEARQVGTVTVNWLGERTSMKLWKVADEKGVFVRVADSGQTSGTPKQQGNVIAHYENSVKAVRFGEFKAAHDFRWGGVSVSFPAEEELGDG